MSPKTHAGEDGDLRHIYFLTTDQTVNGAEDVLGASETLNEAGKQGKNSDPGGPNLSKCGKDTTNLSTYYLHTAAKGDGRVIEKARQPLAKQLPLLI